MKLSAQAWVISDSLSLASAITRGRSTPLLAHLTTIENAVSIRCTDRAVGTVTAEAAAQIYEPGETAVPIDRVTALVSSFAADTIVEIDATPSGVKVISGAIRSRLPSMPVTDLPAAIVISDDLGCTEVGCDDCKELLEPLAAADTGRSRFYLGGVFLHSLDGQLVAVSTDGVRLIRTAVAASTLSTDRTLIVAADVASVLRKLLQKANPARVVLRRSRSLIAFDAPGFSFTARLIEAHYPAYEAIIPAPAPNSIRCDRSTLVATLSRLSAAATSIDAALVTLSWSGNAGLDLFLARQPLDGADAIAADVRGAAKVVLSISQLAAMLNEFSGERIQLETANEQPVVIRGEHGKLGLIARSRWNFRDPRAEMMALREPRETV